MANPPKAKGTKAEGEIVRALREAGFTAERTSPGTYFDIRVAPKGIQHMIDVLATRPDHGEWLATIRLSDLLDLLGYRGYGARVEVKRYRRFALHTIFEGKFGGR